jgi:hypothetical protein
VTAIYTLVETPDAAQAAVDALRGAGVPDADIQVMSSEPFEHHEFGHRDAATWMPWIAALGGATGLATAAWFTQFSQLAWPLPTSGMPIVAPWPNLIVMFELTMLGAILSTVATLLVTAKLPRRLPRLYDPEVTNGYILVGVQQPVADAAAVTAALEHAGPGRVRTID